jgi:nucleotide-binding universal stress UspA family protein
MIKDIVINLPTGVKDDHSVAFAISMARMFEAHLAGVAFAYEAISPALFGDDVPVEWIDALRADAENAANGAIARFDEAVGRAGISAQSGRLAATFAGTAELFGRIARRFDLSIVRQAEPEDRTPEGLIIEAALFSSGRPVLVVPYVQRAGIRLDRIMICWDGSAGAARAAADAEPFLKRAKNVEVVVVDERAEENELPGADIAQHLARHRLPIELKRLTAGDLDIGSVLLSHAADSDADLIVMGGYGHSRFREFILGGVTRKILASMPVPTLLAH